MSAPWFPPPASRDPAMRPSRSRIGRGLVLALRRNRRRIDVACFGLMLFLPVWIAIGFLRAWVDGRL